MPFFWHRWSSTTDLPEVPVTSPWVVLLLPLKIPASPTLVVQGHSATPTHRATPSAHASQDSFPNLTRSLDAAPSA